MLVVRNCEENFIGSHGESPLVFPLQKINFQAREV